MIKWSDTVKIGSPNKKQNLAQVGHASGKKMLPAFLLLFFFICMTMPTAHAKADETATLRVISTTDFHEQLAGDYYDIAGEHNSGSMAKALTLVKEARAEIVTGASVTVDCGDTIYGYSGHFLAEHYRDNLNSMHNAFSEFGYDCITMGNHDFDMGIDYLLEQLDMADLTDLTVCANVYDAITKEPIWKQNRIVKKKLVTSKGRKFTVNIGFVGVTRPALSNFTSHKGILTTTDILSETKTQIKKLKNRGADIIVAVAHSGIGTDSPDELSTDTCYAISKLADVDVVMGGHIHVNYPSTDGNVQEYYNLPNVDQETGLMNGKSVIIVADRGAGIGVADLQLRITKNDDVVIDSRSSQIRYADRSTPEDPAILKYQPEFDGIIKQTYKEKIAPLAEGESLDNFFAQVQDNAALQLVNEAKMRFGLAYVNENIDAAAYKDYPVISVSSFMNAGKESGKDYLNVSSMITMGDLLRMEAYGGNYATIYTLTGVQLREWLEWTASGYQQTGTMDATYADDYIRSRQTELTPLLQSGWSVDWQKMYTFDGVEYDIDISQPARYDYYGYKISDGKRIVKLTRNGEPVDDNQKFLLVSDLMLKNPIVGGQWTIENKIERTDNRSYQLVADYLRELASFGDLRPRADNNWRLLVSSSTPYILKSGIDSLQSAMKHSWYKATLYSDSHYAYYQASIQTKDVAGPTLVLNQEIKIPTHRDVPIRIQATDSSGIATCQYLKGQFEANAAAWKEAETISGNSFAAKTNGIYSVMATDNLGNRTVKYVNVDVIDRSILQVPSVEKLTNRMSSITGITQDNAWVYLTDENGKVYSAFADETGRYTMTIPYLKGDSTVKLYTMDLTGRKSADLKMTVKKTGANYPTVLKITNTAEDIDGYLNDEHCMVVAELDDTVYVPKKGGKEAYTGSNNYNKNYKIVEMPYFVEDGMFVLDIPPKATGKVFTIYSIDHIGRISAKQTVTVTEAAPNKPSIYTVSDGEGFVHGRAKTSLSNGKVEVTVAGKKYKGDIDSNGYFSVKVKGLKAGKQIKARAYDVQKDKKRYSAVSTATVEDYSLFEEDRNYQNIKMCRLTDKIEEITGSVVSDTEMELYIRIGETKTYKVPFDEKGHYELFLQQQLKPGTRVYAVLRYKHDTIDELICRTVKKEVPDEPAFRDDITNKTVKLGIVAEKGCTVIAKVGKKTYKQTKCTYKEAYSGYLYNLKLDKALKPHQKVIVYAKNSAGNSKRISMRALKIPGKKKGKKNKE